MTLPHELLEAARIDGAGPMRFSAMCCFHFLKRI